LIIGIVIIFVVVCGVLYLVYKRRYNAGEKGVEPEKAEAAPAEAATLADLEATTAKIASKTVTPFYKLSGETKSPGTSGGETKSPGTSGGETSE